MNTSQHRVLLLSLALLLAGPAAGMAVKSKPPRADFLVDSMAVTELNRAEAALKDGDFDEAARRIQATLDTAHTGFHQQDGRVVPVRRTAENLLRNAPPGALQAYLHMSAPPAAHLLASANAVRLDVLTEVCRRYFLTPSGARAALTLAAVAFDTGRPAAAQFWLLSLRDRHPDPPLPPWKLDARLAVARHLQRDEPPSRATVEGLRTQLATADAATRDAVLAFVAAPRPHAARRPHITSLLNRPAIARAPVPAAVHAAAGDAARDTNTWRVRWTAVLPVCPTHDGAPPIAHPQRANMPDSRHLGAALEDLGASLLAANNTMLCSVSTDSGTLRWALPVETPLTETMRSAHGDKQRQEVARIVSSIVPRSPFWHTTRGHHVFAVHPLSFSPSPTPTNAAPAADTVDDPFAPLRNALMLPRGLSAIDVDSGNTLWRHALPPPPPRAFPMSSGFSGRPCVDGDAVFVPAVTAREWALMSFDQATGRPRWTAMLDRWNETFSLQRLPCVLEHDGLVFASFDARLLHAVDAMTGLHVWTANYPIRPARKPGDPSSGRLQQFKLRYQYMSVNDNVMLAWKDLLVLWPPDSAAIMGIERETGKQRYAVHNAVRHKVCLGLTSDGGLIMATCHGLMRVDVATGRQRWIQPMEAAMGLGLVTDSGIWLPVDGGILRLDPATGKPLDTIPLPFLSLHRPVLHLWTAASRVYLSTADALVCLEPDAEDTAQELHVRRGARVTPFDRLLERARREPESAETLLTEAQGLATGDLQRARWRLARADLLTRQGRHLEAVDEAFTVSLCPLTDLVSTDEPDLLAVPHARGAAACRRLLELGDASVRARLDNRVQALLDRPEAVDAAALWLRAARAAPGAPALLQAAERLKTSNPMAAEALCLHTARNGSDETAAEAWRCLRAWYAAQGWDDSAAAAQQAAAFCRSNAVPDRAVRWERVSHFWHRGRAVLPAPPWKRVALLKSPQPFFGHPVFDDDDPPGATGDLLLNVTCTQRYVHAESGGGIDTSRITLTCRTLPSTRIAWQLDLAAIDGPSIARVGRLALISTLDSYCGVDSLTGRLCWRRPRGKRTAVNRHNAPTPAELALVFTDFVSAAPDHSWLFRSNILHARDVLTGDTLWQRLLPYLSQAATHYRHDMLVRLDEDKNRFRIFSALDGHTVANVPVRSSRFTTARWCGSRLLVQGPSDGPAEAASKPARLAAVYDVDHAHGARLLSRRRPAHFVRPLTATRSLVLIGPRDGSLLQDLESNTEVAVFGPEIADALSHVHALYDDFVDAAWITGAGNHKQSLRATRLDLRTGRVLHNLTHPLKLPRDSMPVIDVVNPFQSFVPVTINAKTKPSLLFVDRMNGKIVDRLDYPEEILDARVASNTSLRAMLDARGRWALILTRSGFAVYAHDN